MEDKPGRPALTLIKPRPRSRLNVADFVENPIQATLFPEPKKSLLVFVSFPDVSEDEFTAALAHARPTIVFELRSSPRFDIGRLNRRDAFQRFQDINCRYLDIASDLCRENWEGELLDNLRSLLAQMRGSIHGPLMFLLNATARGLEREIVSAIGAASRQNWEVYEIPKRWAR
jgi:hypothetical protein